MIARNVGLKRFNVLVPALIGRPKRSARAAVAYLNVRLCKEIPIVVPALADRKPVRVHLVRIVGEYVVLREGLPACGHNGFEIAGIVVFAGHFPALAGPFGFICILGFIRF